MAVNDTEVKIEVVADRLREMLWYKNRKYGDSALNPIGIFSKTQTTTEKLLARIDDKLARIKNSSELRKNDLWDLMGYLTFLIIANDFIDNRDIYE
jgi:hypothetical protein